MSNSSADSLQNSTLDMTAQLAGKKLLDALESGEVRVAERRDDGTWEVHGWVKEGILDIFRNDDIVRHSFEPGFLDHGGFLDKQSLTLRYFRPEDGVRIVPGGSAVRRGAYLARGVVCIPPMYINIGAWIGAGSMIDSHALVGSCAQIGERVHLSAAAQIGGVLEPIGALPVIVEDDVFVGGGVGIYEGVCVREGAVLAAGVVLTASTPVFDVVNERKLRGTAEKPLEIPPGAVVVPGTRPLAGDWARERGLGVTCAQIVKYRDAKTSGAVALEDALR